MRPLLILGLLPSVVLADETVELLDGRRILLRQDGTYEAVSEPTKGIWVLEARYGNDRSTCDATDRVRTICNGRSSCNMMVNDTVCKPKSDVSRRLTVYYQCTGGSAGNLSVHVNDKMELSCTK